MPHNINIKDWKHVFLTDISKFKIFNFKRREFFNSRPNKNALKPCIVNPIKHGGSSVKFWLSCYGDIVRVLKSCSTPSNYWVGLPRFLRSSGVIFNKDLGVLDSLIFSTCPAHRRHPTLIVFIMFGFLYMW